MATKERRKAKERDEQQPVPKEKEKEKEAKQTKEAKQQQKVPAARASNLTSSMSTSRDPGIFRQAPSPRQERKRERRSKWKKDRQDRQREGRRRAVLVELFRKYTNGMTAAELCILLSCGKGQPGVYFYYPEQLLATSLQSNQVPWPVEFVLRLHPKHVFADKKLSAMSELGHSVQQWEHKLRWRLFHSQSCLGPNHEDPAVWQRLRDKFAIPMCPHRFNDRWESSFQELKHGVFQQAFVMRSAAKRSGSRPSNFNRVACWGLNLLRSGPIGAVRTDKDGGYALVWKQALAKGILASLTLPHYEEKFVHEQTFNDIATDYCGISRYIGEQTEDEESVNSFLSSLKRGCASFITKILTTVKTHRAEGEQSMRIVHAAPGHFAKPAMRWVATMIQKHMGQRTHILKDTDHLLRLLKDVQVPEHTWLLRFGVKDFYMSDKHQTVSDAAGNAFPEHCRDSATLMVDHILRNQIVTDGLSNKFSQ